MNMENWRKVTGYESDYEVSDHGNIRSIKNNKPRLLKQNKNHAYNTIVLSKLNIQKRFYIHRLVYSSFCGEIPKNTSTDCFVIDHINTDKRDNRPSNLRVIKNRENIARSPSRTQRGLPTGVRRVGIRFVASVNISGDEKYLGTFDTIKEAERAYSDSLKFGVNAIRSKTIKKPTSIFRGVSFSTRAQKYLATATKSRKHIHIGTYCTEEEAYKARLNWEAKNGVC